MLKTDIDWPTNISDARGIQETLRSRVIREDRFGPVRFVAGTDVGFRDKGRLTRAAVVVLRFPSLEPVEQALAEEPTRFPYVPGYLSFREVPALLSALSRLKHRPDLILCDGQGVAHPRRFGLACHLGVITGIPCVGVAKSRLTGKYVEPASARGSRTDLVDDGEIVGAVLRTRNNVKPLFVSSGHKVGLDSACDFVMRCLTRYRLPETTRQPDKLASQK